MPTAVLDYAVCMIICLFGAAISVYQQYHFFTGILEYYTSIETFKVVQNEIGKIELYIVVNDRFRDEDLSALIKEIYQKGDSSLVIDARIVDDIPLEKSNKRRFVVSNLPESVRLI